jgi:uncharacterized membrane protein
MHKGRLEAFTDGVIAIVITIMVLDMKVPATATLSGLAASGPALGAYALSFTMVGIFWNNHHHILQATEKIDGKVLLANLFLLFWLSLMPFAIRWMDDAQFQSLPTAAYGFVLTLCGVGYMVLERTIVAADPANAKVAAAVGRDPKAKASLVLDAIAVSMAFVRPWVAIVIYVLIALMWLVPDRRVEMHLKTPASEQ